MTTGPRKTLGKVRQGKFVAELGRVHLYPEMQKQPDRDGREMQETGHWEGVSGT